MLQTTISYFTAPNEALGRALVCARTHATSCDQTREDINRLASQRPRPRTQHCRAVAAFAVVCNRVHVSGLWNTMRTTSLAEVLKVVKLHACVASWMQVSLPLSQLAQRVSKSSLGAQRIWNRDR